MSRWSMTAATLAAPRRASSRAAPPNALYLIADARALSPEFSALFEVRLAYSQIRFANGSVIRYLGGDIFTGDPDDIKSLEFQLRGW